MMKNINEYFAAFVNKVAEETDSGENVDITDLIGYWNEEENQKEFAKLVKLVKTKSAKSSEKKMKDPNKPKRGKSAYIFFCQEMRPKVKTTMPSDAKAPDVTARLGELWQKLKGSTKASDKKKVKEYEAQAADDKKRYDDEMSGYERPSDEELEQMAAEKKTGRKSSGKKGSAKSKRDPNKPKKNKSAYLFFCQDKRATVKESLGDDAKNTEIVARLGELWNELKEESKNDDELKEHLDAYLEQAAEDKKRYVEEMANYEPSDESEDEKPVKKPAKKPAKKAAKKVVEEEEEEDPDATQPMAEEVVEEEVVEEEVVEEEKPKRKLPKFVTEKKSSEKKSVKKLSAYTHFCQEHRAQVKEENPDFKATEVTKALSNMWKELDEEEKAEWKESAEAATQKQ
jgi:hypothetical protein